MWREDNLIIELNKDHPGNIQTRNHARLLCHNLNPGFSSGRHNAIGGYITGTDIFGKRTTNAVENFGTITV